MASLPGVFKRFELPAADGAAASDQVIVTFYGTSTLLFDDGETQLLVDAFITRPDRTTLLASLKTGAAVIGTDPAVVDAWLARPEVGDIRAIFPAHSHHDHAIDVAHIALRTGARVFGSASTLNIARGGGVPETQLSRYRLFVPEDIGAFTVTVLPGRHPEIPPPLTDDRDLSIDEPLAQPAPFSAWVEGGSFAFLIEHAAGTALVQVPSYVIGVLDDVRADVLFLSVVPIIAGDRRHTDTFYDQIIGNVRPRLVVPVHWDDFMQPAGEDLPMLSEDVPAKLSDLETRLDRDGIRLGIMQGFRSSMVFKELP